MKRGETVWRVGVFWKDRGSWAYYEYPTEYFARVSLRQRGDSRNPWYMDRVTRVSQNRRFDALLRLGRQARRTQMNRMEYEEAAH